MRIFYVNYKLLHPLLLIIENFIIFAHPFLLKQGTMDTASYYSDKEILSAADICRIVAKDLKQRGFTQAKAAELMQIDPKAVANQISGKRAFGKKAARKYANTFGYSEAFLLHGEGTLTGKPKEESAGTEAVILTRTQFQELIKRISSLENTVARLKYPALTTYSVKPSFVESPRQYMQTEQVKQPVFVYKDPHSDKGPVVIVPNSSRKGKRKR